MDMCGVMFGFLSDVTCTALFDAINTTAEFDFLIPEDFLLTISFNPYLLPMLQWMTANTDFSNLRNISRLRDNLSTIFSRGIRKSAV